jgi:WD40 repeat protein
MLLYLFEVNSAQTISIKIKNRLVFTCRSDGFINCYNVSTNELIRTFEGHFSKCFSIVLDDEFLYSSGIDNLVKKWNLQTGKLEFVLRGSLLS